MMTTIIKRERERGKRKDEIMCSKWLLVLT